MTISLLSSQITPLGRVGDMFNIGGGEIVVILLVALVALGPEKLPKLARQLGQFSQMLNRLIHGFNEELKNAATSDVTQITQQKAVLEGDETKQGPQSGKISDPATTPESTKSDPGLEHTKPEPGLDDTVGSGG